MFNVYFIGRIFFERTSYKIEWFEKIKTGIFVIKFSIVHVNLELLKIMTAKQQNVPRLSNAQLLLLNMFEHDLSEHDLEKLRKNLVSFLNSKLQEELDSVIKTKKMTRKDINKDEMGHHRTEYLTKIRADK
jgi:hypothetical protein